MKTLIVGCGYLGLEIARVLRQIEPESEVFGTTRSGERFAAIAQAGAVPIVADVFDEKSLNALPASDRIVYCVSFGRSNPGDAVTAMTRFVAELSRREWKGRLVHVSTTGVYGQLDGSWVDEETPCEPSTESGRLAFEAETIAATAGASVSSIRLSGIYGSGRVIGRAALVNGEPIGGDPDRWLNMIHVVDAARLIVAALQAASVASLYLASDDQPISRRVYYETAAKSLDAPSPTWTLPTGPVTEPNKRIRNRKILRELGVILRFPTIFEGLPASV